MEVKSAVYDYEEKIAKEIKENIDKKKLWDHIDKLRKKERRKEGELKIYKRKLKK